MPTVTLTTTKDAAARDTSEFNWTGSDDHLPVGVMTGGNVARSVVQFPISFSGMVSITSATLSLRGSKTGASHASGNTSSKTMYVRRQGKTWSEGNPAPSEDWADRASDFSTLQGATTNHQATKNFPSGITDDEWYDISVTDIVRDWFNGLPNYGFVLINDNEDNENDGLEFYSREKGTGGSAAELEIVYTVNAAPNAPTGLDPSNDDVVSSLTPVLSASFSDPDAGDTMSGYQIQVYEDDGTTLLWDSGTIASTVTSFSRTYAGPALDYNTFYKWRARTKDAGGLWGPYASLARFQTVNDTPPDPIAGLSATANEDSITLDWSPTELTVTDFDHYQVYRRDFGETEWSSLASIFSDTTVTYEDLTAEFGVVYEYKVTQFKNVTGGFDIESPDSDIVQVSVVGEARDAWSVVGADGLAEHMFDLPVVGNPIRRPIQQEEFEPLGSSRKTIVRGRVLGEEGVLSMIWDVSERDDAMIQVDYIVENRGPHVLRSPFGDVWLVEFSGPDRVDLPGGHLQINIAWTEVA